MRKEREPVWTHTFGSEAHQWNTAAFGCVPSGPGSMATETKFKGLIWKTNESFGRCDGITSEMLLCGPGSPEF